MTNVFQIAGEVSAFGFRAVTGLFRRPFEGDQIRRQFAEIGSKSLPLVVASGFALGAVLTLHTQYAGHFRRDSLDSHGSGAGILSGDRPARYGPAGGGASRFRDWSGPFQHARDRTDRRHRIAFN